VDVRILMVSPYPPLRDGIAAYAVQTVARLRAEGNDVEVLSPAPSAAHHHLDLVGSRGALALARRVRHYDRVIVQFHPDFFYPHPSSWQERASVSAALTVAWKWAKFVELRVHEVDYRWGAGRRPDALATRAMFQAVDLITVHTDEEATALAAAFGVRPDRIDVAAHGADFVARVDPDRGAARAALGIPDDDFMFLAIGFIQPHKGFDRAIHAFASIGRGRLDIVGSVRVEEPEYVSHLAELERLARNTPGVTLHTGYVTDDAFDRWLVAADVIVLPYRSIWSSGVLERAALYDRSVIVTRVGGLPAQAAHHSGVTVVDDDTALAAAMWTAAGGSASVQPPADWAGRPVDRATVMAEIRLRAAAARPRAAGVVGADPVIAASRGAVSAPLRRIPVLGRPRPTSNRPGSGLLKRLVRRLMNWELEPIVHHVNQLREATIDALENPER
jgi:glycosyltransferase involved in cell wall biosynthesis